MLRHRPAPSRGSQLIASTFVIILVMLAAHAFAADLKFPPLTGRVVDDAGILSASTKGELDAMLAQHEHTSGEQVVVVTLDSLQGHTIEDYGYQLGRYWGIGQKGKNTGAILIVAPKERKVRIEVGYGLEGQLTDAASRVIIENFITPQFRKGDFDAGVLAGTAAILRGLGDDDAANLSRHQAIEERPDAVSAGQLSPSTEFLLLIFLLLLIYFVARQSRSRVPYLMRHGGGPYWGSGGGSSGGRGFSGGGGSFGGGGASGSW